MTFCENSYFRGVNLPEPEEFFGLAQRLAQSANPEASFDSSAIDFLAVRK